jgi:hypothetical protein
MTVITRPLSAKKLKRHVRANGRVRLHIKVRLHDLIACAGIDAFNDLVDERLYGKGVSGCLVDLRYRPVGVRGDGVIVEVDAETSELELEAENDNGRD